MSSTDYVFDGFARPCDVCGTPRAAKELQLRDGIAICVRHPGYRTAKELDRLNAQIRVPIPVLPKYTRPLSPVPTWEVEEGQIFDLATSIAPLEIYDNTSDAMPGATGVSQNQAAAWGGLYLALVIAEGKRPAAWLARARVRLAALADFLLARQDTGAGTIRFGVINPTTGTNYLSADLSIACLVFCKAYQLLGGNQYLAGAKAAAHAMVSLQAGNLFVAAPSTYGGAAHFFGPVTGNLSAGGFFDYVYNPASLACAWAMTVLKGIAGDITVGELTTLGGTWSAPPARLLSISIAQQLAFWQTGVANDGTTTVINGLSAATPFDFFNGAGAGGTGLWSLSAGAVTTSTWALGLRALYEVVGATAQTTAAVAYLQTLGQRASTLTPAGLPTKKLLQGITGTFSGAIAPPFTFDPALKAEATGIYSFAAAGLLAPLVGNAALDAAKDAVGTPRRRTQEGSPRDGRSQYLGRMGLSGFSFQPWSNAAATQRQESVTRAAQTGLLYRVSPATMGTH